MKNIKPLIKTRYGSFYAKIAHSAKENVYHVSIPSFPEVLTEARTLVEAKKYAQEVIELQCLSALDAKQIVIDDTRRVYGKMVPSGAVALA